MPLWLALLLLFIVAAAAFALGAMAGWAACKEEHRTVDHPLRDAGDDDPLGIGA